MKKKTSDQCCGVDILDYFAAHALTGILANRMATHDPEDCVKNAYIYAVEMLKESERLAELRKNEESDNG